MLSRDGRAVLEPEVEQVAHDVQGARAAGKRLQESMEQLLAPGRGPGIVGAEMRVGYEENGLGGHGARV
jgi:hypothetical protein